MSSALGLGIFKMYFAATARIFAIGGLCLFTGCTDPLNYFPSFEGPVGLDKSTASIRVDDVANRVRCELSNFVKLHDKNEWLIAKNQLAALSLKMETDHSGKVSWIGIDLSKLGPLAPLGNLISSSNKVPTLQASGQVKSAITSQLDFNVSQNPNKLKDCSGAEANPFAKYYLSEWLEDFARNATSHDSTDDESLCLTKITLSTAFTVVLDVSGGFSPVVVSPIIVPLSGVNFDYSPTFIHTLTITLIVNHPDPHNPRKQSGNPICKLVTEASAKSPIAPTGSK